MKTSMLVQCVIFGSNFIADVEYTPGTPATMYQNNGDPGDPAEPSECDIKSLLHNPSPTEHHNCTNLLDTELFEQIMEAVETAADTVAQDQAALRKAIARRPALAEAAL